MRDKHPYFGVRFDRWMKDLLTYGITRSQLHKYKNITKFSGKLTPLALYESALYQRRVAKTDLAASPIFLLGHWRSGTTHLQNLLTLDPQWAYLNTIQSIFPGLMITQEENLKKLLPAQKRYMDDVKISGSTPSEEEISMATLAQGSFWNGYFFTKDMDYYFNKYVLFDGITQKEYRNWKGMYHFLMQKIQFVNPGKQLVLKNPPNTARVKMLLELYPDAKFVFISRNPVEVYLSRLAQYDTAVKSKDLQNMTKDEWESKLLRYYPLMMNKYLDERDLIPKGNLVEITFESLKADPLDTLSEVYSGLNLGGFSQAVKIFKEYIAAQRDYKQNSYDIAPEVLDKVSRHWGKYQEIFGYDTKPVKAKQVA